MEGCAATWQTVDCVNCVVGRDVWRMMYDRRVSTSMPLSLCLGLSPQSTLLTCLLDAFAEVVVAIAIFFASNKTGRLQKTSLFSIVIVVIRLLKLLSFAMNVHWRAYLT